MEQQISATTAWIYSVLFAYLPYVAFGIKKQTGLFCSALIFATFAKLY